MARGKKPRTTSRRSSRSLIVSSTMCGPSSRNGSRFSAFSSSAMSRSSSLIGAASSGVVDSSEDGSSTLNWFSPSTRPLGEPVPILTGQSRDGSAHCRAGQIPLLGRMRRARCKQFASLRGHSEKLLFTLHSLESVDITLSHLESAQWLVTFVAQGLHARRVYALRIAHRRRFGPLLSTG